MHYNANLSNPFRQSSTTWVVELTLPFNIVAIFAEQLESDVLSAAYFEKETGPFFESRPEDKWVLQLFCQEKPDYDQWYNRIAALAAAFQLPLPSFTISLLPDTDWVAKVQEHFPAFRVGAYFIHGSHYNETIPPYGHELCIDAGRAFGTGEHETTSGCLKAMADLARSHNFTSLLDMGCGSGILAIAMAKTWKKKVLAVDIDKQAVLTARRNVLINQVKEYVQVEVSNGYLSRHVARHKPYDLIVANILAKPLVSFSAELKAHLAKKGIVILSGLLAYQEPAVLAAHRRQGLTLIRRYAINGWNTLLLKHS